MKSKIIFTLIVTLIIINYYYISGSLCDTINLSEIMETMDESITSGFVGMDDVVNDIYEICDVK